MQPGEVGGRARDVRAAVRVSLKQIHTLLYNHAANVTQISHHYRYEPFDSVTNCGFPLSEVAQLQYP